VRLMLPIRKAPTPPSPTSNRLEESVPRGARLNFLASVDQDVELPLIQRGMTRSRKPSIRGRWRIRSIIQQ